MNTESIIFLLVIGFILYKMFSGNKSSNKKNVQPRNIRTRQPNRRISQIEPNANQSLIRNAQKLSARKNYDEASNLYLRAGQVFTAAKTKLMKGPSAAEETIEIIKINAPDRFDKILDNLINEFYYRKNMPAISAALLRAAGYHGRAEAIEVASGISVPVQVHQTPVVHSAAIPQQTTQDSQTYESNGVETDSNSEIDSFLDKATVDKKLSDPVITKKENTIENTLMMAQSNLKDSCMVCKKTIRAGQSFIYCLHCGKVGHYKDFGEMMKVTGKCPSCKERLVRSMYNFE